MPHGTCSELTPLTLQPDHYIQLAGSIQAAALQGDGESVGRMIAEQEGIAGADQLIDALVDICAGQPDITQLAPHLARLLPPRVGRACELYDNQDEAMPPHEAERYLTRLRMLCDGIPAGSGRATLARSLVDEGRKHPSQGNMDALMRRALLEPDSLSEAIFFHLKLDSEKTFPILKMWEAGYGRDTLPNHSPNPATMSLAEYMQLCAQRVLDIERQRPGGIPLLARRYHIRNVGRVPEDWLLDTIDNGHKRYARVIFAAFASRCGNGAAMQGGELMNETRKTLPADTIMIPMEIARPVELLERLRFLERVTRISDHEIAIAGISIDGHGHHEGQGSKDEIELGIVYNGRGSYGESLAVTDIEGAIGGLLLQLLAPEASAMVLSCNMAKLDNGWAARLCKRIRRQVVGMREAAGVRRIDIELPPGSNGARYRPQLTHRTEASPTKWQYHPSDARYLYPAS
jgi:hypothetical protein